MTQEKYLIGGGLRRELRETIDKVKAMPTRLEAGTPEPVVQHPVRIPRLYRGTFNGSWAIGATQSVRYINDTGSTVAVSNYCVGVTQSTGATSAVIFSVVAGTMTALEIQQSTQTACITRIGPLDLTALSGWDASKVQLLGHSAENTAATQCASLMWYTVTTCSTAA